MGQGPSMGPGSVQESVGSPFVPGGTVGQGPLMGPDNSKLHNIDDELFKFASVVEIFTSMVTSRRNNGVKVTNDASLEEVLQLINTESLKMLSKDNWKSLTINTFKKVLPTTMVLKAKYNSLNEFVKLKARLVCLGNLQTFKGFIL